MTYLTELEDIKRAHARISGFESGQRRLLGW